MQAQQGLASSSQAQPPAQRQPVVQNWQKTWHSDQDVPQRRQLIGHIYRLFTQRKPNVTQEWQEKLPDFVRRLEEALYRTAQTKEEYADTNTLEQRLQYVARRMVNRTGGQQSRPPGVPGMQQSNGFVSGAMPAGFAQPGSFGPPVGVSQMMPQQQGSSQQMVPNASGVIASSPAAGAPPAGGLPAQPSLSAGLPTSAGLLPNGGYAQQPGSAGLGLDEPSQALPKLEPGLAQMGSAGLAQASQAQQAQQHPALLRAQAGSAPGGAGPMMSNGAPVLLRNSRDWVPGQSPSMINTGNGGVPGQQRMMLNGMVPTQLGPGGHLAGQGGPGGQMPGLRPQAQQVGPNGMMPQMPNGLMPLKQQAVAQQWGGMVPVGMQQGQALGPGPGMVPMGSLMAGGPGVSGGLSMPGSGQLLPSSSQQLAMSAGSLGDPMSAPSQSDPDYAAKLAQKKEYIAKQQRWLLFLRHCAKCQAPEGQCQYGSSCAVAKQLWRHILSCADPACEYPRCVTSRELLKHHQKCSSLQCPVCTPVKQYVQRQRAAMQQRQVELERHKMHLQQEKMATQQQLLGHAMHNGGMVHMGMGMGVHPGMVHTGLIGVGSGGLVPVNHGHIGSAVAQVADEAQRTAKRQRMMQENLGTSLVEAFSLEEIRVHLHALRLETSTLAAQQAARLGRVVEAAQYFDDDNTCRACGGSRLTFEPPSLYCTCCGQRIKRNQVYYCTPLRIVEVKGYWCHACYSEHKGDRIDLDGTLIRKLELEKRKNDEEMEEGWVQCDRCEGWVHQICGLFNKGRNDDDIPFLCPGCLMEGLQLGQRRPLAVRPQAMLEARDLPRCALSDHLEAHLAAVLQEERVGRAKAAGLLPEQVPGCEGLTLRVINNVGKRTEVKPRFLEAFQRDGYPEDGFSYKQKVILLFQRIEGVDVCLYCLYTQEYGEDCPMPNRRWVYLSYLDSVKYFRPELEAHGVGCALRTLVYHEILLAYLAWIKAHGFATMFIWACPPLQGDDYILYCHPNRQKTPRSDRLREWYHTLLRTAKERGTVTYVSNLFDTFFEGGKDHRIDKPSVCHLPYFEGDYWPGEAENLLANLGEEARQAGKKGGAGGAKAGKARAKGKRYGGAQGSTDEALLGRLGDVIQGMKDDFMVVHLQEPCSFCRAYISAGPRHYHPAPPRLTVKPERTFEGISLDMPGQSGKAPVTMSRFQLCQPCYDREANPPPGGKALGLPTGIALSELRVAQTEAIPPTGDNNPDIDCEFFHTRQAFLSLCQGNHYQFDSMRRAKHSSMMVLYHLHNPDAPAFACTCNSCGCEIEPGQGFRCTVCSDFDMCANCKANPAVMHPHPLQAHARKIDETRVRMTEDERKERAQQLQRTMTLLVHASACSRVDCPSSNCSKVKALFQHAVTCTRKVTGGCHLCRRMWALLQLHAKSCQATECPVPRCKELREMRRRQMARQEDQRRLAYQAMLRQQAAARQAEAAQRLQQQHLLQAPQAGF